MGIVWSQLAASVIYGLLGILLMGIGYRVIDWFIPADLNKGIEDGNMSAGIVVAGAFIAIGAIVAMAIK
ncbi:MAG: DUF350 domain-containing protein [Candidatus Saccharibacteria bacterium]